MAAAVLTLALAACGGETGTETWGVRVVGHSDLGGEGLNGPVAVVGRTAVVGAGRTPGAGIHTHFYNPYPCGPVAVKLVDLSDPARPRLAGTIPVPAGVAALDVAARTVETPSFRGDLAAVALARCGPRGNHVPRGVAYYDVTDPAVPQFLGRYQADVDTAFPADVPPCGEPPDGGPDRCASSQHSVDLMAAPDGRLLSLSTEPGASASNYASGDLRAVDVTDPRSPRQVGSFPPPGAPIFTRNGCRPFRAGHAVAAGPEGRTALLADFDGGLVVVDLRDPSAPEELGRHDYPDDRGVEGNAAYATTVRVGDRILSLVAEEDWIAPETRVEVSERDGEGRSMRACQAMFSLFDPGDTVQVYRHPDSRIEGEIVYVGRGCPTNEGWGTAEPDPYLSDPGDRIALVDRMRHEPAQPGISEGSGCSMVERVKRAQAAGARAVIIAQTRELAPEAFSPDGDADHVLIPAAMVDKADGDALRSRACPPVEEPGFSGETMGCDGSGVEGALVDRAGEWGGLRLLDVTDPTSPEEVTVFRTERARAFPPPDNGVYSVHHAEGGDGVAYVAWNSAGLRVLRVDAEGVEEVAGFIPEDVPDPTGVQPPKAMVVGVAPLPGAPDTVVVTDVNSGLYVVEVAAGG